jgi:hypothetical protein
VRATRDSIDQVESETHRLKLFEGSRSRFGRKEVDNCARSAQAYLVTNGAVTRKKTINFVTFLISVPVTTGAPSLQGGFLAGGNWRFERHHFWCVISNNTAVTCED